MFNLKHLILQPRSQWLTTALHPRYEPFFFIKKSHILFETFIILAFVVQT